MGVQLKIYGAEFRQTCSLSDRVGPVRMERQSRRDRFESPRDRRQFVAIVIAIFVATIVLNAIHVSFVVWLISICAVGVALGFATRGLRARRRS